MLDDSCSYYFQELEQCNFILLENFVWYTITWLNATCRACTAHLAASNVVTMRFSRVATPPMRVDLFSVLVRSQGIGRSIGGGRDATERLLLRGNGAKIAMPNRANTTTTRGQILASLPLAAETSLIWQTSTRRSARSRMYHLMLSCKRDAKLQCIRGPRGHLDCEKATAT